MWFCAHSCGLMDALEDRPVYDAISVEIPFQKSCFRHPFPRHYASCEPVHMHEVGNMKAEFKHTLPMGVKVKPEKNGLQLKLHCPNRIVLMDFCSEDKMI